MMLWTPLWAASTSAGSANSSRLREISLFRKD
jgi:hypothetical protein